MAYTTKLFILFLIFVAVLLGYNYVARPLSESRQVEEIQETAPIVAENKPLEESLFETLDTKAKVSQVLAVPMTVYSNNSATASAELPLITDYKPGFAIVFGNAISTTSAQLVYTQLQAATVQEPLDIGIMLDHEGGAVQRYNGVGFTRLPSWQELCANESSEERVALLEQSAQELQSVGVAVVLAPVFDTKVPGSPLTTRTCSSDQAIISERSKEYIRIMEKYNILPVLKHFPNIGFARNDLHTTFDSIAIKTDDLLAFKSILNEFPNIGVMTTHVGVTNQDADIPCSLSVNCVNQLTTMYPDVLVISDALDMRAAQGNIGTQSANLATSADLSIAALQAGNDILIIGEQTSQEELETLLNTLIAEYNDNQAFKEKVDRSVKKIIRYKLEARE